MMRWVTGCAMAALLAVASSCEGGGCWGNDCSGGFSGARSCTDTNGVCIEVVDGSADQLQAFESQCLGEGGDASSSPCASCTGPICRNARLTAVGVKYIGNICYGAGFCGRFPNVDTGGACSQDQGGTPEGQQCTGP